MFDGKIRVELQRYMGSDADIANAAWTSTYDKTRREDKYDDPEKVAELVKRLAREGHSVPFESVVFRFWIRLPIFADRQHMTHRIASHNGQSGRYRTLPPDWFGLPDDVMGILAKTGENNAPRVRTIYDDIMRYSLTQYRTWVDWLKREEANGTITNAEFKRCRESLRAVVPTANMTERTTVINLRSFANYQRLRNSDHAQPEIREVARQMYDEVECNEICPVALAALKENGWRI
jgi:thymidylate synthase (FAD)